MKTKRIIGLLLVFAICLGLCVMPAVATSTDTTGIDELYALGIIDSTTLDLSRPVTRIEMLKYATRLYGPDAVFAKGETMYADVPAENENSGVVNFAVAKGIISPAAMFYPERTVRLEEALKMIEMSLEYGDYANIKGGYPYGYLAVASEIGLLKGIEAAEGNGITVLTAVNLLKNAIYSSVCNSTLIINSHGKAEYYYDGATSGDSVLNKRFNISVYDAFITEVKTADSQMRVEILSKDRNDSIASYNAGDKPLLTIGEKTSVGDVKFTYADIYVNDEDEVIFVKKDKNIETVTGYIYEVNKSHNKAEIYPGYIKNIAFEDSENYIDMAESPIMYFDGEKTSSSKPYSYVGAFARAVIYNDEIIALEAWELSEGGIVTKVGDDGVEFRKGETAKMSITGVSSYKEFSLFINGIKSELWALVSGTMFDYFMDEDKESLIIVASTRAITDTFDTISQTGLTIGGDLYPLSEMYNTYYANVEENYSLSADAYSLLGRTVTAYIDYAGYVRYVRPVLDDELSDEYYAFIMGYNQDGLADPELQAFVLDGSQMVKKTYSLAENLVKNQKLLIEKIKAEIETLQNAETAQKNEVIKHRELFYKIRVNGNGEISNLRPAPKFSEPVLDELYAKGETGYAHTDFTSETVANTSSTASARPRKIYFDKADIIAIYYDQDAELIARVVPWNDLKARSGSNLWLSPFASEAANEVEVMLLRGDVQSIGYTRTDYIKSGFCNKIYTEYDVETEKELTKLNVNGETFTISKYIDTLGGVTEAAYLVFSTGNSFLANNEIKIITAMNLSGAPDTWELAAPRAQGVHKDEISKIDTKRVHFTSGDKWYMGSNMTVYEIVEGSGTTKFVATDKTNVPSGVDVWYVFYNNEIRALFFRK